MGPHRQRKEVSLRAVSTRLLGKELKEPDGCWIEGRWLEAATLRAPAVATTGGRHPKQVTTCGEHPLHLHNGLAVPGIFFLPLLLPKLIEVLLREDRQQIPAHAKGHCQRICGDFVTSDKGAELAQLRIAFTLHEERKHLWVSLSLVICQQDNIITALEDRRDLSDLIQADDPRLAELHHRPEEIVAPCVEVALRVPNRHVMRLEGEGFLRLDGIDQKVQRNVQEVAVILRLRPRDDVAFHVGGKEGLERFCGTRAA
mmetsp:Transcript_21368/g.47305  ORF Transcript_21368/g.47305 Transcript_21368/m.47305 type:complete len:257 (+) Transcript_21368:293-1063(+)